MSVVTDIRKNVAQVTPVMAVLGATDLAVAKVRQVAQALPGEMEQRIDELQALPSEVADTVQQVPAKASAAYADAVDRLEHGYETLAERGKHLVEAVENSAATQSLIRQSKATVSRTKAAMTVAQRSVTGALADSEKIVDAVREDVKDSVDHAESRLEKATEAARKAAEEVPAATATRTRRAVATSTENARRRATQTRAAAKGAVTSARKTATKADAAAAAALDKMGEVDTVDSTEVVEGEKSK